MGFNNFVDTTWTPQALTPPAWVIKLSQWGAGCGSKQQQQLLVVPECTQEVKVCEGDGVGTKLDNNYGANQYQTVPLLTLKTFPVVYYGVWA